MNHNKYRADIDGLRTIAVLGVILFHMNLSFIPGGFVGVDVFFVISGFLITGLIKSEIESDIFEFKSFYIRRIRRLLPAAICTILASFVLSFLLFSKEHFAGAAASSASAILSISNVWFWAQSGYFDSSALTKPLLHTWTLGIEEQFYLVWPAILVYLFSANNRSIVPAIIFLIGGVSLYFAWAWIQIDPTSPFFLMPFRVYEFAIGASMAWIGQKQVKSAAAQEFMLLSGLAIIAWSMLTYTENTPFPSYTALAPCLGTALVIYAGQAPISGWLLRNRAMTWIGERSYSLYLTHWPVIVFYSYYLFAELSVADLAFIGAATLLTAYLQHRYIEVPLRIRKNKATSIQNKPFAFYFGVPACALIAISSLAYTQDGWGWRISGLVQKNSEVQQAIDLRRNAWHESLISTYANGQDVGSREPNAKTALIIGDSHAAHIRGAFDYIGKKYNIRTTLWYYVGCNPLFGTTHVFAAPDPRQDGCIQQNKAWEEHLKTHKYDYIVISSRWAWTVEPTTYGPYTIPRHYVVDVSNPELTLEASRNVFVKSLERTVQTALKSAGQVIVFAQSPNNGKSLDGCDNVPRYLISEEQITERCKTIDKGLVLQRQEFTNSVIRAEAEKNPRVHAVIPTDFFCEEGQPNCTTFHDGFRLFQDETHFTVEGAKYLALKWEKTPGFPFKTYDLAH